MTSLKRSGENLIFNFSSSGSVITGAVIAILIFLLVGLLCDYFIYYIITHEKVFSFSDGFRITNRSEFEKIMIMSLFGFYFTLIPIILFTKLLSYEKGKYLPKCFVVDFNEGTINITDRNNTKANIGFKDIHKFDKRYYTYTTGSKRRRTVKVNVITCYKEDGSYWDIHESTDETYIDNLLAEIQMKFDKSDKKETAIAFDDLPEIIKYENINNHFFYWKNKVSFMMPFLAFLMILPFFITIYIATLHIIVLIFGIVFMLILLPFVIKKTMENIKEGTNLNFVEISGETLKYGKMDKNRNILNVRRKINITDIEKIAHTFDFEYGFSDDSRNVIEVITNKDLNDEETDESKTTKKKKSRRLDISIYGLSVTGTLRFEKKLESILKNLGKSVL